MSLQLDEVRLSLGERHWRFDIGLPADGVHALLGRSGSGKSTLLNLVGGYLRPDAGHIRWMDQPLNALAPAERPVTTLFQHDNLFAHLSVADNVGLGLDPSLKLDTSQRAQVSRSLRQVGLADYERRKPASLSGGERQRVALARCLLRNRPILLMDEPFGALDPDTRTRMIALTRQLIERQRPCVIMVTHDEDDAHAIGAGILELIDGKVRPRATDPARTSN